MKRNHSPYFVMPSQSSVRKGDAGSPSALKRLHSGLSAQAQRTATGFATSGLETTTELPWPEAGRGG
jgi:hypothetical protein